MRQGRQSLSRRFGRTNLYIGAFSICLLLYFLWIRCSSNADMANRPSSRVQSLTATGREFALDGRPFRILSGAIHYFRVVPAYWRDRLLKLKAMGLNTVETYVAWNFHEQAPGNFDFTSDFRDIARFVRTADSLGLHVIVRPGPYICGEWDNGGLPAWLLRNPKMKLRTMHPDYIAAVDRYLRELLKIVVPLQRVNGGPIIAFQAENEFGSYSNDVDYVMYVASTLRRYGVTELIFTSDGHGVKPFGDLLQTVNFQRNVTKNVQELRRLQPNRPVMVTEYWSGWFDHWTEGHHLLAPEKAVQSVTQILDAGGSINFFMFHGGTNFGFYNGANDGRKHELPYSPTVTSYDYDAPLSEAGDPTEKFIQLRSVILHHAPKYGLLSLIPPIPLKEPKLAYASVQFKSYVPLLDVAHFTPVTVGERPLPMEQLTVANGVGQAFGFALYNAQIPASSKTVNVRGVRDRAIVLIDGVPMKTIELNERDAELQLSGTSTSPSVQLSILVENCGRVNFGEPPWFESKGITGSVSVDGKEKLLWNTFPLDFTTRFVDTIIDKEGLWKTTPVSKSAGPIVLSGKLNIAVHPKDTFVNMEGWTKGIVIVNGFNLGRYWNKGPQRTLYLPGPLLRQGENTFLIVELHQAPKDPALTFKTAPELGKPVPSRN